MKHPLLLKAQARHLRVTEKGQKRNRAALDRAQDKTLDKPTDRPVVDDPIRVGKLKIHRSDSPRMRARRAGTDTTNIGQERNEA